MALNIGVIMDPIQTIHMHKDTTFALLLEAQCRGHALHYMEQQDLYLQDGIVYAKMQDLQVQDNATKWFELAASETRRAATLDLIFMRKDPPVDREFIYTTQLLELVERDNVWVINKPQSLRDVNEKLFIGWFPHCCVPTLVTSDQSALRDFLMQYHDIVVKPLYGMGGFSVFRLRDGDPNINVTLELLTNNGQQRIMAQRFIPEISQGDKRVIMIDGEPLPYALARLAVTGETRANLAAGGYGVGVALSERDRWICQQVAPTLRAKGLFLVGLDIIGDYLTEVNVTSPTCIRELEAIYQTNFCARIFERIEQALAQRA